MQAESRHPLTSRTVYAWWVDTDTGTGRTWAATAEEARSKAEAKGRRVMAVRPAESLAAGEFPKGAK